MMYIMIYICWFLCRLWRKTALEWIRASLSVIAGANCPCPVLDIFFTADKTAFWARQHAKQSHLVHTQKCSRTPMHMKIYRQKSHQQVDCLIKPLFMHDESHNVRHTSSHIHTDILWDSDSHIFIYFFCTLKTFRIWL